MIDQFDSLRTSNFLVFGLDPQFAERFVYDSLPYGLPTKDHPLQVIEGKQGQERYTGHQARLLMCKETLDPSSPMTVVSAVDEGAVNAYVEKHKSDPFVPPSAYAEFKQLLPEESTQIENDEMAKRKALLEQTDQFINAVKEHVKTQASCQK